MIRAAIWIGLAVMLLYSGCCALLFCLQRSFIYFPQREPSSTGEPSETLTVPGARLQISLRPRPGRAAVLYFGGNAEWVSASLPKLAQAFPDASLYLLHYRGYGQSTGTPSEAALHADALALFDRVAPDHPRVVVIGRSLGTGVAIRLAAERPVARLILVTPYDSIVDLAQKQMPWVPVRWLLLDRFESWRYAPKVRAHCLILAAARDQIIPEWSSRRLYSRFRPGSASYQVLAGDHNSISDDPRFAALLGGDP